MYLNKKDPKNLPSWKKLGVDLGFRMYGSVLLQEMMHNYI